MIPWQVCLWSSMTSRDASIQRISCFQPIGSTVTNLKDTWTIPHIVGLAVEHTSGGVQLLAGSGGPVPVQNPDWLEADNPKEDLTSWVESTELKPFDDASTEHFLIDGSGGEVITEVHATANMKAFKLYSNRVRSCHFGEKGDHDWLEYKVEEGEMIVGLVCAFGRLGGWSFGAKMHSHWHLSGLGVLTVEKEYMETI